MLLMGLCVEQGHISLIMEHVQGKDLADVIADSRVPLSLEEKLRITKDIAIGSFSLFIYLFLSFAFLFDICQVVTGYTAFSHPSFTEISSLPTLWCLEEICSTPTLPYLSTIGNKRWWRSCLRLWVGASSKTDLLSITLKYLFFPLQVCLVWRKYMTPKPPARLQLWAHRSGWHPKSFAGIPILRNQICTHMPLLSGYVVSPPPPSQPLSFSTFLILGLLFF